IAYIGGCALPAVVTKQALRRRILIAAVACLFGTGIAYATWCYRNYLVFNAFQYSTVSGENLLKWNARGMERFLGWQGKQELRESLKKYPTDLSRYNEADQFALSDQQGKEGLRLILKYPASFQESHLRGTLESTFIFRPKVL